jgi:hypothetical protein
MNCSSYNALKSLFSSLLKFSFIGVALCSLPIPAQFLELQETQLTSGPELFEAYLNYRETVGMLNPPLQMPEEERNLLLAKSKSGDDLMTRIWGWWLSQPSWFMGHGGRADALDERLIRRIWPKGDQRQLIIWEHPGKGMVYASLVDVETDSSEIIARRKAPDWVLSENETTDKFREREIGNRRVTWRFASPYVPPPAPEPPLQPFAMMSMSAPNNDFRVEWVNGTPPNTEPNAVRVHFGSETSLGPLTVWRHTTGDLTDSAGLPGVWMPIAWMKERPAGAEVDIPFSAMWEEAGSGSSPAGGMTTMSVGTPGGGGGGSGTSITWKPVFVRANLGVIDSDTDTLDDGFELWYFGSLDETSTGDPDTDGISTGDEYSQSTNPTDNIDTDTNGLPDDWELFWDSQFSVFPNPISATLPHRTFTTKAFLLNNPVNLDADFTVTVTNNLAGSQMVYDLEDSLTGGADYNWSEISATGTRLDTISDVVDGNEEVTLSNFTFPFYGINHSSIFVSSNGMITFGSGSSSYINQPIPTSGTPNNFIAPFWEDLNTSTAGDIYILEQADRLIVQYEAVAPYSGTGSYTFQVVLHDSGLIEYMYKTMDGELQSATIGLENTDGTNGLEIAYNEAYIQNGLAVRLSSGPAQFVKVSPMTGTVSQATISTLSVTFNSFDLAPGTYTADIDIAHTGTGTTPWNIPAVLNVINTPANISITNPENEFTIWSDENMGINVSATDNDFGIERVEFYYTDTKFAEDLTPSYYYNWTDPVIGTHQLTARAVDQYGAVTVSQPITVTVLGDSDLDRMEDTWEQQQFGSLGEEASTDFDGDGIPNIFEYHHGTDPTDAQSKLEFSETQTGNYTYYLVDETLSSETDVKKKTISAVLASAKDFDVIEVKPGAYTEALGTLYDRLYIFSSEGARNTTIDVQGLNNRALYLRSESVFSGLTFQGANPTSSSLDGGAVYLSISGNQNKPRFIGCRFIHNVVGDRAGAVYVASADPTFISCTFAGNVAATGNAMYNGSSSNDITLINTLLWNPGVSTEIAGSLSPIIFDHSLIRDDATGNVLIDGVDQATSTPGMAWDGSLIATSVARNAGTLSLYANPDLDGEPLADGLKDIGADEFTDTDTDGLPDWLEAAGITDPLADVDGDGLQNLAEYEIHLSNPHSLDTDGDTLEDDVEITLGTNPNHRDTDFDGLPDDWEVQYSLNPIDPVDVILDADGDGYSNWEEYDLGYDPTVAEDSDTDGIPDGIERSLIYRTPSGGWGYLNINNPDTDNNGTLDGEEDYDLDGLTVVQELALSTDPNLADTDGDGANDGDEITMGTDPLVPQDFDTLDTDGDGLTDLFELAYGTDPFDEDTNDNKMNDGEELDRGGDPRVPGPPPGPLPPPGPPPPPEPPPAPPTPLAPANYKILVDTVSHSQIKHGFSPYQQINPTKRFLVQTSRQRFSGGSPESGPLGVNATKILDVDPLTGDVTETGDVTLNPSTGQPTPSSTVATGGTPDSPFRRSGENTNFSPYWDPPNQEGDDPGTLRFFSVLSGEYLTEDLLTNAASELPDYTDTFVEGTPFAYRNLHENELRFDYQKVRFKFEWEEDVEPKSRHEVKYWILYRPEDDPDTEDVDESLLAEVIGDPIVWDGQAAESPVFEIDPETLKPDVDGEFEIFTMAIVPDWNRDRQITEADKNQVTENNPLRFWINDDDDVVDIAESDEDLPGQSSGNHTNAVVDGRNDLVDFFPLWLDLAVTLDRFPIPEGYSYRLRQEDAALRFVYTDLTQDTAGNFLVEEQEHYGETYSKKAHEAETILIDQSGTALNDSFLQKILADSGKGILLLEGVAETTHPLVLEIHREESLVFEADFELNLSPVEDMYRWMNLRPAADGAVDRGTDLAEPANRPDDETNGEHFIFVHGYSVHEEAARAWNAELFKRLHQSGANTAYTAVTWRGNEGQLADWIPFGLGGATPDYYSNVENAFETAEALSNIAGFHLDGPRTIAGHSLGNMVVSSAIRDHGFESDTYLMLNAAVAMEAYDATAMERNNMRNKNWRDYTNTNLWASEYYTLFPVEDNRSKLSWRDYFGEMPMAVNFHSSTEDVLANGTDELPLPGRVQAWVNQEMRKGTTLIWLGPGNTQGGWGFNGHYQNLSVAEANVLPVSQLITEPFFTNFDNPDIHGPQGSALLLDGEAEIRDSALYHQLMADAIPALSQPVGRNPLRTGVVAGNADYMVENKDVFDDGDWPRREREWRHSDLKNVAYPYVYRSFESIINIGGLK